MAKHKVTLFEAYPFKVGQKIRIEGSKRRGDWEVIGLDDRKVKLRCPVSGREFDWDRFCYHVKDEDNAEWPQNV